jgi:hypothetical protein
MICYIGAIDPVLTGSGANLAPISQALVAELVDALP